MPATGGRFLRRGNSSYRFVTTVASISAPTAAEINAGVDITHDTQGVTGLSVANTPIDTPDMSSAQTKQIPGVDALQAGVFTIYEERTTNPLRATLAKGTRGFIVINPSKAGAAVAADIVDVFPVEVSQFARTYASDASPAVATVGFTVTDIPGINVTVA